MRKLLLIPVILFCLNVNSYGQFTLAAEMLGQGIDKLSDAQTAAGRAKMANTCVKLYRLLEEVMCSANQFKEKKYYADLDDCITKTHIRMIEFKMSQTADVIMTVAETLVSDDETTGLEEVSTAIDMTSNLLDELVTTNIAIDMERDNKIEREIKKMNHGYNLFWY